MQVEPAGKVVRSVEKGSTNKRKFILEINFFQISGTTTSLLRSL